MKRALFWIGLVVALCALGCGPPPVEEAVHTPPVEEAVRTPPAEEAGAADDDVVCTLDSVHASLEIGGGPTAVAVARRVGPDAPTAVVVASPDALTLVRVDGDALTGSALPLSGRLLGLAPSGEGFLLLTVGPCAAPDSARCLRAHYLRVTDAGLVAGAAVELPQSSELRSLRVVPEGELVYLARSYRTARPTLDRFGPPRAVVDAPTHERMRMAEAVGDDEPVEILALAADGAAWALMYRHGATEDPRSGVVLATQLDEHHVEILEDMLVVESVAWVGNSIAMVAAFEFARPAYLRLGPDGEVRVPPREVPFGLEVPEPFGGRLVVRPDGVPGHVVLEVRNGAGDRRGEPIPLANARIADLTREPGGFLVAWLEGGVLRLSHLRC